MKKLIVFVVFALAGLVVFNYATTGEIKVVPSFSKSAEEQSVEDLADRFASAQKLMSQAHRQASMSGIDTTSDAAATEAEVKKVQRALAKLEKSLTEPAAKRRADDLAGELEDYARTF